MNFKIKLQKNINKNYLFTLLQNLDLTRGIWMIYLAGKGMSLTQLGFLETIFHITSFTMEVPTGAIADIFGRKISRVAGRILSLISVVLLLMSNHFWGYAMAFVFTALSYNLESGAGDALIYDSLKELGDEGTYMKINGRKEVFYQIASVLSFFVGGYLATKSYPLAFVITIIIGGIAILQSLSFTEPTVGRVERKGSNENDKIEKGRFVVDDNEPKEDIKPDHIFIAQLKGSIKVIRQNPKISFLIFFGQLIGTFCTCIFFYNQNFLKADGFNEAQIGGVFAVASLTAALLATQVYKIEKQIKEQGILFWIPWITVLCIFGIALTKFHFIFFIIMMTTESITYIALTDYINKLIPSENRATILSFASMVFSFFMILLFPVVGVLGDLFNLKFSFVIIGSIGLVFVLINSIMMRKTLLRGTIV